MTQKENHTDIKTGGGANISGNVDANQFTGRDHFNVAGDVHIVQQPPVADGSPTVEEPTPGDPPYMGLRYFTEDDAHLFFGRDALTTELVDLVTEMAQRECRFLAIIGASGSGKSSLVRAGLVPALRAGKIDGADHWPIHIATPTAQPLETLALALTHNIESVTAADTLIQDMAHQPTSLHLYISRMVAGSGGHSRLLLIIDQFEELFTLCKDRTQQRHYIDNLMHAANTAGPTLIILTLRADFYANCAQFDELRTALESQQKYIGAMNPYEVRQAVQLPAEENGWHFEGDLLERILDDVGDEPGRLPLLSHALRETWERRQGRTLTQSGYREIGRVQGAIAKTADRIYELSITHKSD